MKLPVRVRMTAWYVALLALVVTAIGAFLVVRLRADLTGEIDRSQRPEAAQVGSDYAKEGVPEFVDASKTVLKGDRATAQLLDARGTVLARFGEPVGAAPMIDAGMRAAALRGATVHATRTLGGSDFRLVALRIVRRGQPQVVVAAQSLNPVDRSVRRVVVLLLIAGPAALLVTALGGWWLARRALRPVERMTTTAEAIGVHELRARVADPGTRDEIGHLARTLNGMLDRVEHGVQEQRRLVADASHELRTPLAAMRAEIDVSLWTDDLSPAARAVLASAREEVDGMTRTVDDLLTLAAADDGRLAPRRVPADLEELAGAVADGLRSLAVRRGVELDVRSGGSASVHADPALVSHAIRNLVENAIKFSPAGGVVVVTAGDGRVLVEDEGPGVPAELRERVFDRFFRVDASRTRATGGTGLGLAIAREIADAHGGRVWAAARSPRGSAFVLELPLDAGDLELATLERSRVG